MKIESKLLHIKWFQMHIAKFWETMGGQKSSFNVNIRSPLQNLVQINVFLPNAPYTSISGEVFKKSQEHKLNHWIIKVSLNSNTRKENSTLEIACHEYRTKCLMLKAYRFTDWKCKCYWKCLLQIRTSSDLLSSYVLISLNMQRCNEWQTSSNTTQWQFSIQAFDPSAKVNY